MIKCKEQYNKLAKNPANFSLDKTSFEAGWRAALEGVLSQLKRPIYSADIMKWIEKELEKEELKMYEEYSYYVGVEVTCKRMPMKYGAWIDKYKECSECNE